MTVSRGTYAFLACLLSSPVLAGGWVLGPSISEDQIQHYRIIDPAGPRTAGWAVGWDNAVYMAGCKDAVDALEALMAGNPQLANAAKAVNALALIRAGRANIDSITSPAGTSVPPGEWLYWNYSKWTLKGGVVWKDGVASAQPAVLLTVQDALYAQTFEGAWYRWTDSGWSLVQ
jgi:hypothetical protein